LRSPPPGTIGSARSVDALRLACDGRFPGSYGQMCRLHLDAYDLLTGQIATLDELVAVAAAPFAAMTARLAAAMTARLAEASIRKPETASWSNRP
jgi:hypothetical protein